MEHKIQSEDGPLVMELAKVPKVLSPLVKDWAPKAFVISFKVILSIPLSIFSLILVLKLETDPELLIPKSKKALETYGHQMVIGNILSTRKQRVVFVFPGDQEITEICLTDDEMFKHAEIEEKIIQFVIQCHQKHMKKS